MNNNNLPQGDTDPALSKFCDGSKVLRNISEFGNINISTTHPGNEH